LDHSGDKFAEDGQAREPAAIDTATTAKLAPPTFSGIGRIMRRFDH
jgi:hypothetical protein